MESAFSDTQTLEALSKMREDQQLAFGAACCERMLPNYVAFMSEVNWGEVGPLRQALDMVWEACAGPRPPEAPLRQLLSLCEQCVPESEDYTSLYTSSAQDAVFSVCSLLEFLLGGDPGRIVNVPRFATDSVDLVVQEREDMDTRDALREQKILEHPLMQQELARERRDLGDASDLSPGDRVALLALRTRARGESNLLLAS